MFNNKKYTEVWKKYLPLIKLFLKKNLSEEQDLTLNSSDFHVGNRDKSGYNFTLNLNNGKAESIPSGSVVGDNLYELIESDLECKRLLVGKKIRISMNKDFKLSFKSI